MSKQQDSKQLPDRSEVPVEYTWRLEDIFANDDLWNEEYDKLKALIPKASKYKGTLGQSAQLLVNALRFKDELYMRLEQLYAYAHMRYDQDTSNSFYQALDARAKSLFAEASSALSFFTPELLSISEQTIEKFLAENKELRLYRHALERLNQLRPHVLSEKEEAILAQAADVLNASSTTFGLLNNADLEFPSIVDEDGDTVQITHGRYIQLMESNDRRVRKEAFEGLYHTYEKFKNTFASTLSGTVKKNSFIAKMRGYKSARHAALSKNHITENVYDQLVSTINEHLPLLHRYVEIRKRALGYEELHMYDLYNPLVPDAKMKITYPEAQQKLLEGLAVMGDEYLSIIKEAYENRWVDVTENKGKRSGAYSSGSYSTNPYILLNWQDTIDNLFTLAHEFGHSVHSYYTRKHQPYVYGDYTIFVAEVASTCNEALLNDYLIKQTTDKQQKLYLLNHYLDSFRATVFRQTMFAEFEDALYQKVQAGHALTADLLTSLYYDLNKKYYGNTMVSDQEIGLEWARIPHFYYNYYVYQYATGFSAATALSKQILSGGKEAVNRYTDFLKAGNSDYPIEVLKKAGVDMTTAEPIKLALKDFEEKLNELEQLLFT